jgi:hypothetical protein
MSYLGLLGRKSFLPQTDTDKGRTTAYFTTEPQRTQRSIFNFSSLTEYTKGAERIYGFHCREKTAMKILPSLSLPRTRSGGEKRLTLRARAKPCTAWCSGRSGREKRGFGSLGLFGLRLWPEGNGARKRRKRF